MPITMDQLNNVERQLLVAALNHSAKLTDYYRNLYRHCVAGQHMQLDGPEYCHINNFYTAALDPAVTTDKVIELASAVLGHSNG